MGPSETELNRILGTDEWEAPDIQSLEVSLHALDRVLGDLSQENPAQWSGEAARQAASAFSDLRERYQDMKDALREIRKAVDNANMALWDAREEAAKLPSATVPSWIHTAVKAARAAGQANIVIGGYSYVAEKAVSLIEEGLSSNREERAYEILETLSGNLELENERLSTSQEAIRKAAEIRSFEDGERENDSLPTPHLPPRPPRGPQVPDLPEVPPPGYVETPDCGIKPWPPDGWVPSPDPRDRTIVCDPPWRPGPVDPPDWEVPDDTGLRGPDPSLPPDAPRPPGPGLSVDSDSRGTIGGNGLGAGLLGGGGAAGAAALRWGTGAGTGGAGLEGSRGVGPAGMGTGVLGATGAPGLGGLSGRASMSGSAGTAGAAAGGRGLGAGAPGGGAASGSGAGGAGARSGMVAGAGGPGAAGGSDKKGKRSGLAGHIAPKLEDDEDFTPQSSAALRGSRDGKL